MPTLVAGMAGNPEIRRSSLLVRSMAMGQATESNAPEAVRREVMVAICNEILCGPRPGRSPGCSRRHGSGMKLGFVMLPRDDAQYSAWRRRGGSGSDASRQLGRDPAMGGSVLHHDRFGRDS